MSGSISRYSVNLPSVSLNTAEGTTPEIDFRGFAGGMIYIPGGSSITLLTYWTSASPADGTGTYIPLQDIGGVAVTQIVAATKAYPLPEALFGAGSLKIVVNTAGDVDLSLKG